MKPLSLIEVIELESQAEEALKSIKDNDGSYPTFIENAAASRRFEPAMERLYPALAVGALRALADVRRLMEMMKDAGESACDYDMAGPCGIDDCEACAWNAKRAKALASWERA